ncbi:MAG: PP2C family protein-serine/threonine phosphatase [Acidobacteriota bacterium]|nr:PP2C family protein-serine/threonine phosphatase [Acidobacteriota bacterium]NLT33421.1 serine/threonine-protein phosphatase [Acidobacteriota bacterium]
MRPDELRFEELHHGAQFTARHLAPAPGAVPAIPGIDIYGRTVPLNGMVGGDLITYVNFQERFCLETRIREATRAGRGEMVQALRRLEGAGGILVADVAGHGFVDAMRALILHQAFHTGALYEMDLNGEITVRLFEQVNTRFLKSRTLRDPELDRDPYSFITLIYGEIESSGRFHFINAGHPLPLVFSNEFDRFVDISPDRFVSYPPIGLQPGEGQADAVRYEPALGYKKNYTVNELNLMGRGDILLLYTDGLLDPFSEFNRRHLERVVSSMRAAPAREICSGVIGRRLESAGQSDDLSLVVIKRE